MSDPVDAICAIYGPIFEFYSRDRELGRVFLEAVTFAGDSEPELRAVTESFIGQLALMVGDHTDNAMASSFNIFAAYFAALTGFLAGRITTLEALKQLFRVLIVEQRKGWVAP